MERMPESTQTDTEADTETEQQAPAVARRRTLADFLALRSTWTIGFTALTVALVAFLIIGALVLPSPKGEGYAGSADITFTSISMISPDDGWAAGSISGAPQCILMHYQRGLWTIVPRPAGLEQNAGITQVQMLSATDGWALSATQIPLNDGQGSTTPGGVILHYDGTAWTIAVPRTRASLLHLSMDSPTDGWAVGSDGLLLHYNGHTWSEVQDSGFTALGRVTLVDTLSPQDVWVNGDRGLARFDGARWSRVTVQDTAYAPGTRVTALAMLSDQEGWAIAGTQLLHDQNGVWSVVAPPRSPLPVALAVPGPGQVWLVGYPQNQLLGYAHGQWQTLKPPVNETLAAITFVSPTDGWAVGAHGTILHYSGGSWQHDTNVTWDKAAYSAWAGQ